MKTALVCAGGVGQSFFARMPEVLRSVGPVKASSLRVARRISNSLRAGRAVDSYAELDGSKLIWIVVSEEALDRIVTEVAAEAGIEGAMIVLCATRRDSLSAGPLRMRGARVATLDAVEPDEKTLVAEGNPQVVRELRRLAAIERRKLIQIEPESKVRYLAAVRLAANLPLTYFAAAMESLRASGFSRADAARLVEVLGTRSLRAYGKSGRKAWNRETAADLRQSLTRDLEAISQADRPLAALYRDGIEQALRYFSD